MIRSKRANGISCWTNVGYLADLISWNYYRLTIKCSVRGNFGLTLAYWFDSYSRITVFQLVLSMCQGSKDINVDRYIFQVLWDHTPCLLIRYSGMTVFQLVVSMCLGSKDVDVDRYIFQVLQDHPRTFYVQLNIKITNTPFFI